MEFSKCFVFKNFPEFSDQIYNPYNKTLQKCLEFFDKFG